MSTNPWFYCLTKNDDKVLRTAYSHDGPLKCLVAFMMIMHKNTTTTKTLNMITSCLIP